MSDFGLVAQDGKQVARGSDFEFVFPFLKQWRDRLRDFFQEVSHIDLFDVEGHLPCFDFREVEDVIDDVKQVFSCHLNFLKIDDGLLKFWLFGMLFDEHFAVPDDGIHWGAKFVTHIG